MGEDTCADCDRPVRRVITMVGRRVDLQLQPHDDGNYVPTRLDDGSVRARVLTGTELPAPPGTAYRRHTCPPKPLPGPACGHCGEPMDRELSIREKWSTHPACDPELQDEVARLAQIEAAALTRRARGRKR